MDDDSCAVVASTTRSFFYVDAEQNIQGPYEEMVMMFWHRDGSLPPDTLVSEAEDGFYLPWGEVVEKLGPASLVDKNLSQDSSNNSEGSPNCCSCAGKIASLEETIQRLEEVISNRVGRLEAHVTDLRDGFNFLRSSGGSAVRRGEEVQWTPMSNGFSPTKRTVVKPLVPSIAPVGCVRLVHGCNAEDGIYPLLMPRRCQCTHSVGAVQRLDLLREKWDGIGSSRTSQLNRLKPVFESWLKVEEKLVCKLCNAAVVSCANFVGHVFSRKHLKAMETSGGRICKADIRQWLKLFDLNC